MMRPRSSQSQIVLYQSGDICPRCLGLLQTAGATLWVEALWRGTNPEAELDSCPPHPLSEPGEGLDAVPGLTRLSSRPFRTSCQTGRALIEQRHELLDLTAWLSHPELLQETFGGPDRSTRGTIHGEALLVALPERFDIYGDVVTDDISLSAATVMAPIPGKCLLQQLLLGTILVQGAQSTRPCLLWRFYGEAL